MYKVNVKTQDAINSIRNILSTDEMLLHFGVSPAGGALVLTVKTETQIVEYRAYVNDSTKQMVGFLLTLKTTLPVLYHDDVDGVLEELGFAVENEDAS